jgi:hypothetical protein
MLAIKHCAASPEGRPKNGWQQASAAMLSPICKPMSKSLLKSRFRAGFKTCARAWSQACSKAWHKAWRMARAAAGLVLALSIVTLPILARPGNGLAAESLHCLSGDEQRAAIANGKTMPLANVIHTLRRAPKDVIKAQLCQEADRLIYKLTLLGRDGKVKRATVDASNGAVVGER